MTDIDIHHPHQLGKPACRAAVASVAGKLSDRFGLGEMTWAGDTIAFAGHGMQGQLTVGEIDAHVQVRLGPMLGVLRPAIEAEIRRRLREYLG